MAMLNNYNIIVVDVTLSQPCGTHHITTCGSKAVLVIPNNAAGRLLLETLGGKVDLAVLGAELTPDVTAPLAGTDAGGYLFQLPFVGPSAIRRFHSSSPSFSRVLHYLVTLYCIFFLMFLYSRKKSGTAMVAAYNLPTLQTSDPPLVRTHGWPAVVGVFVHRAHRLP